MMGNKSTDSGEPVTSVASMRKASARITILIPAHCLGVHETPSRLSKLELAAGENFEDLLRNVFELLLNPHHPNGPHTLKSGPYGAPRARALQVISTALVKHRLRRARVRPQIFRG